MGLTGKKKNYLEINGLPVLARTVKAFEDTASIDEIIIVTAEEDIEFCQEEIVDKNGLKKVAAIIAGGVERQDSVANGVEYAADNLYNCDIILVHDGARPLVTTKIINDTIEAVKEYGSGVAAVPVKDTIKEIDTGGNLPETIRATLPRDRLRAIQTPQGFLSDTITEAFRKASEDNFIGTDESSLVERLGVRVRLVPGSYENIKITTIEDVASAEAILNTRKAAMDTL